MWDWFIRNVWHGTPQQWTEEFVVAGLLLIAFYFVVVSWFVMNMEQPPPDK